MFEIIIIGSIGAACIAWVILCWKKILNFDFWEDE